MTSELHEQAARPKHVTVVDRFPDFMELMQAVLAERSCAVSGLDVNQAQTDDVARTSPDLVIVAIGPRTDDPARRLYVDARRTESLAAVPFLVATSAAAALPPRALPDAIITMPFEMDDLLSTVEALLDRREIDGRRRFGATQESRHE